MEFHLTSFTIKYATDYAFGSLINYLDRLLINDTQSSLVTLITAILTLSSTYSILFLRIDFFIGYILTSTWKYTRIMRAMFW